MKFLIVFTFLFIINCLEPSAISATINTKNNRANSAMILKKIIFRERITLKYGAFLVEKNSHKKAILIIVLGVVLLVLGISLITPLSFMTILFSFHNVFLGIVSLAVSCVLIVGGLLDMFG